MRFWNRGNRRLEGQLRASRPRPSDEFVRSLARELVPRAQSQALHRWSRVSFAAAITVFMVGMLASFGGLSYAASAPARAVDAVTAAVRPATPRVVQQSAAQAQYEPTRVTLCHVLPNGRQVTITVAEAAVAAHLAHGDYLGACVGVGGIAGAGGGGTAGVGGGGTLGGAQGGSLPFTGLSLAATGALSGLLLGIGVLLRRRAAAVE